LLELLFLVLCKLRSVLLGFRDGLFFVVFSIGGSFFGGRRWMAPSEAGMAPRRWAAEAGMAPSESVAAVVTTAEAASPTTFWTRRRSTFSCRLRWFFACHANEVTPIIVGAIFSETLVVRNFRHSETNGAEVSMKGIGCQGLGNDGTFW
jgi:hypothetical protein